MTEIHPAFSHDGVNERDGKLYFIPDLIADRPMDMVRALRVQDDRGTKAPNFHIYYCGPALGIPETIQRAMEKALTASDGGQLEEEEAAAYIKRLVQIEDRFHTECF